MSVIIETTIGNFTIDLYFKECPVTSTNFLKLCKIKYYNGHLFYNVQHNFIAQSGDPTGTGKGGTSIYGVLNGEKDRFFKDEIFKDFSHNEAGTIGMASNGKDFNTSQFYITLREGLDYLDGKHSIFGRISEGNDIVTKFNETFVDKEGRPNIDIRILHTIILFDPFPDPPDLIVPPQSPIYLKPPEETVPSRLTLDEAAEATHKKSMEEMEEDLKKKEAKKSAVVLEIIGDIPDADIKPPENVLFVCKLNPVTEDSDLQLIFSRFGEIQSCEIIRDKKTGESLQYGFIEFENKKDAESAYFKMDNALIDDRRIHVDFSQSVSKLWNKFHRNPNRMTRMDLASVDMSSTNQNKKILKKSRSRSRSRKRHDSSSRRRHDRDGKDSDDGHRRRHRHKSASHSSSPSNSRSKHHRH